MTTLGVLIGRMQPPHVGHIDLLNKMLEHCDHVLVLLGSSKRSRDTKNPFRWQKRAWMATRLFQEQYAVRPRVTETPVFIRTEFNNQYVMFQPLRDYPYSNTRWQFQVQKMVTEFAEDIGAQEIVLYGNKKDESSWYLDLFPRWEHRQIPFFKPQGKVLNASDVRNDILRGGRPMDHEALIGGHGVNSLMAWKHSAEGRRLCEEAQWIDNFKEPYAALPYPPVFQTVDTVITWRGLVLLGKRRGNPGKGLWALPGGYVNANEWIEVAAFRELGEEARTKVYLATRNGRKRLHFDPTWTKNRKTYDYPGRSQRGRIITTRFHIQIPDHLEVQHEAADDLQRTQFFPIHDVLERMDYEIFEDHQQIIGDTVLRY